MREKKCKRVLECKLTDGEFISKAKELSLTLAKHDAAEDKLKSAQTQIKAEIQSLEGEVNKLKKVVASGIEFRELECLVHYDWDAKTKSIIRPDTGETVDVDIIPESDLQEHFSFLKEENEKLNKESNVPSPKLLMLDENAGKPEPIDVAHEVVEGEDPDFEVVKPEDENV